MRSRTIYSSAQALLAFVGTADAGTLYWAHRNGIQLPCTSGDGCDLVASSHWALLGPFPVALLGLIAYISLLFAAVLKLTGDENKRVSLYFSLFIVLLSAGGTCFSWYLQYVSAVFIGAFCIYCRTSAIVMTLLFIVSSIELWTSFKNYRALEQS